MSDLDLLLYWGTALCLYTRWLSRLWLMSLMLQNYQQLSADVVHMAEKMNLDLHVKDDIIQVSLYDRSLPVACYLILTVILARIEFHTTLGLSCKLTIFISATLISLHYNIYKNRVKLATCILATSTSENGANWCWWILFVCRVSSIQISLYTFVQP